MGGCATKPKVLKGDDAPEPQVSEGLKSKDEAKTEPVTESKPRFDNVNVEQKSEEKVVAEDRGENKAAEINHTNNKVNEAVADDKVDEKGGKRRSLSLLFQEKQEGKVSTEDDSALPEELKRQEPMEAEKIIAEAQSTELLKQEATKSGKSPGECRKDEEVPLEKRKASGESESPEPVKHVPAESEPSAYDVKNQLPTEANVEKGGKAESQETSVTQQEPGEAVKSGNEPVKEESSNVNEASGEPDTKFVDAKTMETPSEQTGIASEVTSPEKDVPDLTNQSEGRVQSDAEVAMETAIQSSDGNTTSVSNTSGEPDSKVQEIKTLEKPVEQVGLAVALNASEEEAAEHKNHSAVALQSDGKPAKTIRE